MLCSHFGQLIDGVLASTLTPGRVSALSYAKKLTDAIVLLGPSAVATVMFAHFGTLFAEGRLEEVRALLVRCVFAGALWAAGLPEMRQAVGYVT